MTSYSTRHTGDDYPTIPQPCDGKNGRQTFCSKAHYAVIAADYVMDQLMVCEVRGNPVATATCLFTLKALFERSLVPRVMQHYCQRGLLSVLVNILDTPLQSSHHHPQLVLHRLAMEILWLFSQVTSQQPATSDPMTSDPTTSPVAKMLDPHLVSAVWRFIDPNSRFFQFSPLVARTLNEEYRHARFPKQCLTSMPVTPQVWEDVALYMPWLSPCQPRPRHLLSLHTQGPRSAEGVGRKLLSKGLAWPGMPPPPPPPSQSEPTGQTSAPSCADPLGSGLKSGGGEGSVLCGDDTIFLNASGGHYFWVYADSEARDTAQHISQVLRAEFPSLKTVHPRVGDMVIVTHGEKVHLGREGVKAADTQGERESTGRERRERVTVATQGERESTGRERRERVTVATQGERERREKVTVATQGERERTGRERRMKVTVATQGERERRMKVTAATQGERERRERVTAATQGEKVDVAGVVRGRVLEVKREVVRVLAVDYGTVVRVEARCVYRPSGRASHVAAMEPQATLCRLAGLTCLSVVCHLCLICLKTDLSVWCVTYVSSASGLTCLSVVCHLCLIYLKTDLSVWCVTYVSSVSGLTCLSVVCHLCLIYLKTDLSVWCVTYVSSVSGLTCLSVVCHLCLIYLKTDLSVWCVTYVSSVSGLTCLSVVCHLCLICLKTDLSVWCVTYVSSVSGLTCLSGVCHLCLICLKTDLSVCGVSPVSQD
ncbi:hypothetical protein ACOMHN_055910 [Nucella lapillus]